MADNLTELPDQTVIGKLGVIADSVWNYIDTHQDDEDCYLVISKLLLSPPEAGKDLIIKWALGNLDLFNKAVYNLFTVK